MPGKRSRSNWTVLGPTSSIMASAGMACMDTVSVGAWARNSRATTASMGRMISQPASLASAMMSRAVACISASCRLRPTPVPPAARKVLAMAPPITSMSTRRLRLPSSSSLVDTLLPPTMAQTGRSGLPSAWSSASSSACIIRPAWEGRCRATPSVLAWARWAAEKASFTYRSASPARSRAKPGSLASSPGWKRVFSSTSTSPSRIAATAAWAAGPTVSAANATGRPSTSCKAAAMGASVMPGTGLPLGRSKWLHTMTRAPASASSRMVGDRRSMRVRSLMRPSRTGTFRSARSSTRRPFTSTPSRVGAATYIAPNRAAVSAMRLLKPHSLSYQPTTRASC